MARSSKCTGECAPKVLDTADIVREAMLQESPGAGCRRTTVAMLGWTKCPGLNGLLSLRSSALVATTDACGLTITHTA